jgi:transcriptional regulator with XRE-family HTH domain
MSQMKASALSPTFCRNLKAIREARGLSMRALAEKISSSPNTIFELENGKTSPTLKMIERLSEGLHVDSDMLLTEHAAEFFLSIPA